MLKGRVDTLLHCSHRLEGNALGDPVDREVLVVLPEHYELESRSYPVVVCLTGFTGSGYMLMNRSGWTPSLPERLERLVASGDCGPMILVMPDCFTRLGGSQYLDSSATGAYESYLTREIVPFVQERYRCLPPPDGWALMGKSSGGYGAIRQGMQHPDLFAAVACHSGDMYFEYCYLPDFPKALRTLRSRGGPNKFLDWFDGLPRKTNEALETLNILAMSACYSPNPSSPHLGIDLPFDLETGELRPEVWERWLQHDPIRLMETHREALERLKLLYLDCGTKDEYALDFGARIFASRLRRWGIKHVHEEFDDGHMSITYRYERSLVLISKALGGES